jgi:DNA polymerase-3 subunit delta'
MMKTFNGAFLIGVPSCYNVCMSLFEDDFDNGDDFTDFDVSEPLSSDDLLKPPHQSSLFLGHENVENEMLSLWNSGRMPHAFILNGIKGIGKATFAYRLARFILKESEGGAGGLFGDDMTPENLNVAHDHPVSAKVASGGHPDILTIARPFDERKGQFKNEIPVDDIRKVAPFLRKTSGDGGWRIVIVDDANMMNRNGQNALLKILEEPPKNALLMLVTHGAGGLLPTIRSRCRFVAFDALDDAHVSTLLNKAVDTPVMPSDGDILKAMTHGSAGQAIELLQDDGISAVHVLLGGLAQIQNLSEDQIDALALSYGKSGDAKTITQFHFILNWWFETLIDIAVKGQKTQYVGGIELEIPMGYDLKKLLMKHEEVEAHIHACLNGNLDKRYMIFKTLRMIQNDG